MPFNGSGVFQRVRNWVADATAGIKIRADYHDTEDDNFAAGLTNCITRDGQSLVTANIPWNSKRITGLADPVNAQDAVTKNYLAILPPPVNGTDAANKTYVDGGDATATAVANTAQAAANTAQAAANAAQGTANTGVANAATAQNAADTAQAAANNAQGTANAAVTNAATAQAAANAAQNTANTAQNAANAAQGTANAANTTASNALPKTGGTITGALTVQGPANFANISSASLTTSAINCSTIQASGNIGTSGNLYASGSLFISGGTVALNHPTSSRGLRLNADDSVEMFGPANVKIRADGRVEIGRGIVSKDGYSGGFGTVSYTLDYGTGPQGPGFFLKADDTGIGWITTSSDYRIKKDVIDLPGTWDSVKALRPISYTQAAFGELVVADDVVRWGFIAHELQDTLIQSAATAFKDVPDHIQSPNHWTVIAALTKALQEAMSRIEALEGTPP